MKVLFDFCFDQDDVHYIKLVLNYSLEYPSKYMQGLSAKVSKILEQFEESEWLFDCLPDSDDGQRVLDFSFSRDDLHLIAYCTKRYRALSDELTFEVRCHVLSSLFWSFFD